MHLTRTGELGRVCSAKLTRSADKHLFRLDDEGKTPMMREDMNFELGRVAKAAGIGYEVTAGMLRRVVAHKVFEQRELEPVQAEN